MPQNDGKIQLGNLAHNIDWQEASKSVKCLRGRVVVEMLPDASKAYGFVLPENVAANLRPDIGVVIAAPERPEVIKGRSVPYPKVGTLVAVRPYDGMWIEGAECGDYEPGQLRCYGVFVEHDEPIRCDWWDSIVLEVEGMKPTGNKILFKLDPKSDKEGLVLLSDFAQHRTGMATIEEVGPLVWDVKKGDRVCLCLEALTQTGVKLDLCDEKDFAIGTELCINYIVQVAA